MICIYGYLSPIRFNTALKDLINPSDLQTVDHIYQHCIQSRTKLPQVILGKLGSVMAMFLSKYDVLRQW